MKLHTLFTSLCCLFCLSLAAQQQPDARSILDRAASQFRQSDGIEATFSVRTSAGNSSGTIRLKGDKFLLEAGGAKTWFDGHTQWSYLASTDEVNISRPTAEELQAVHPYAWLSLYRTGYVPHLRKAADPATYEVELTAGDRKQDPAAIVLTLSRKTCYPLRISLRQRNGETAEITVHTCRAGQRYPDSLFTFDRKAYPTAEIIDLR